MTKTAWTDNNYEGKVLRRVFTRLLVRFEKEIKKDDIDLDKLEKVSRTLTMLAKTKGMLAFKETDIEKRIKMLELMIPADIKKGTIISDVVSTCKELPRFSN